MKASKKELNFQLKQLKELRSNPAHYENSAVYTVLLDLIRGTSLEEVKTVLELIQSDFGDKLEKKLSKIN